MSFLNMSSYSKLFTYMHIRDESVLYLVNIVGSFKGI